jgi:hypothetical protein
MPKLLNNLVITPCTTINKLVLNYLKSPKFFSIGLLLAGGIDASVLLIMMVLVAIITFLAGIAYGIYLNDKMSTKKANNQLTEG